MTKLNPELPQALENIFAKALEKDSDLRYQTAAELRTDLKRLRRDLDSSRHPAAEKTESSQSHLASATATTKSVAVLYFENLSGNKEDEYLRDGITEDVITELCKIRGLNTFSRPTVLAFRDKPVTPAQIGKQLGAAYVLTGTLRRSGARLRINAQLVDTRTDFPLWSERFDREMKDVFEVQDEMARKIAEALRVTLSPQELEALAVKPTENLQAYDLFLRGKRYARRQTRQDLEFALQMFENAVVLDPSFALAYAACANACAMFYCNYSRDQLWVERAREASGKAVALRWDLPEVQVSQAWVLYAAELHNEAVRMVKKAIERKRDCEGAYYMLCRALFAAGRYQEVVDIADTAIEASGEDYNVYVPIHEFTGCHGQRRSQAQYDAEIHRRAGRPPQTVPEDARARVLLGNYYAERGTGRRRLARTQSGHHFTRQRSFYPLQRRVRLLRLEEKAGSPGCPAQSLGSRFSRMPSGRAVIPISPSFTANPSSSASTPKKAPQPHPPPPTSKYNLRPIRLFG